MTQANTCVSAYFFVYHNNIMGAAVCNLFANFFNGLVHLGTANNHQFPPAEYVNISWLCLLKEDQKTVYHLIIE